jgi:hypothetical protein
MNKRTTEGIVLGALVFGVLARVASGQDIPVRNWTAPTESLGKSTLLVNPPSPFSPVSPPCRLYDSRVSSGGPGPIPGGGTRALDFIPAGSASCGTLPANVVALSLFFTVVGPAGPGFLYAFPTGSPPGTATSIINYNAGEVRNNAAIVPVQAGTGSFTVGTGGLGTDVIVDINGVYYNDLTDGDAFVISSTRPGLPVLHVANLAGNDFSWGIVGEISNASPFNDTAGVRGNNLSTTSNGIGVWGSHAASGWGLYGEALGTTGVGSKGVCGFTLSGTDLAIGVHGLAFNTVGKTFGLWGETDSNAPYSAGALGVDGSGLTFGFTNGSYAPAGVRGESVNNYGVYGFTNVTTGNAGVAGVLVDSGGVATQRGNLGYEGGATDYAVYAEGSLAATGTKLFIEPHPEKAGVVIRYISLEGPEAGTYVRGRGRFQGGLATIDLPEDFRMVTDGEGLSIQVTPIGEMATVAVVRIGLDGIVVKGSRNVEFFYTVNGVRKTHKNLTPMGPGDEFTPQSAEERIPAYLSPAQKDMLISNGTYNADGTVNAATAKAMGWDKVWQEKSKAAAKDLSKGPTRRPGQQASAGPGK